MNEFNYLVNIQTPREFVLRDTYIHEVLKE
jgi:hypothetical protein